MFSRKKKDKDKESKEERKKEKKDKKEKKEKKHKFFSRGERRDHSGMSHEELAQLEESALKRGIFNVSLTRRKKHQPDTDSLENQPMATQASDSSETSSLSSMGRGSGQFPGEALEGATAAPVPPRRSSENRPPVPPKPAARPKKGILKSSFGKADKMRISASLDDTHTLARNTVMNENLFSGDEEQPLEAPPRKKITSPRAAQAEVPLFPTLGEKTFNADLRLPAVAPPKPPRSRDININRQPTGDFGFSLRRGVIVERTYDNKELQKVVHFAEPTFAKNNLTGLLPGDRLVEVNGVNVEQCTRDEVVEMIKKSGDSVNLKVQPIPELSELTSRTGSEAETPAEQSPVHTGTLKRSGSMRYKKDKRAKSEDQVAEEQSWLSHAEKVWLVHKGGFAGAGLLPGQGDIPEGRVKVKLDHGGEVLEVDEDDVEKANPTQHDRAEDIASLRYLNESGVLHTLRQRYGSNLIHTYAGPTLLVINPMHPLSVYSDKVIQMFKGCKQEDMPPHIYAAAQTAYRNMLSSRLDQSLIFLGSSGSGKTMNSRHVLQYLATVAGTVNNKVTVEKLNAVCTILEAFGNSKTAMNNNATRYAHITTLDFDHSGQVVSAAIQTLLLDKSRVVRRPEGELSFNVFYQLLAGADSILKNELYLSNLEPNMFITPLDRTDDRQRASLAWARLQGAMEVLGFTDDEQKAIWSVLAAVYHLGAAGAVKGSASVGAQFAKPSAAQKAASLLGYEVEELAQCVFKVGGAVTRATSFRGGDRPASSPTEPPSPVELLEGMAVGLYAELFNVVVSLMNRCLASTYRSVSSMVLLDVPGFQNPQTVGRERGASFEDLCYNYANERLQLSFHDTTFTSLQDRYAQENIDCSFETVTSTPAPMVAVIDKPGQQGLDWDQDELSRTNLDTQALDHKGLLWILEEESLMPGATEESFLQRVYSCYGDGTSRREGLVHRGTKKSSFILRHAQGSNPVQYDVTNWLKHARESPATKNAAGVLQDSQKENVCGLFAGRLPTSNIYSGSVVGLESASSLRRISSIRKSFTGGAAAVKKRSLCMQVKYQVDGIMDTIKRTRTHFVCCLMPQVNAGLCDPKNGMLTKSSQTTSTDTVDMLNVPLVRSQIRGMESLEAVRTYRQGYPEHMLFGEFRRRFEVLAPAGDRPNEPVLDERKAAEDLLSHLDLEKTSYRMGLSQVFFRAGALAQLEDQRDEKTTDTISKFQAHCRGYIARQNLKKIKVQELAIRCIQRNVKIYMAVRNWPWFRLVTKVLPLLNVHRTEDELKEKLVEVDQLKAKLEKIEKERNDLRQANNKLETKVADLTSELSDEHSTANSASEMLETETGERMKLEKEMTQLQDQNDGLQQKMRQMEIELTQMRLIKASRIGAVESDEEEDEGESIYRVKYERAMRENEFIKKQLQQKHEDEMEQHLTAKKQLERKLADALEDAEEQQRQVSSLKKKCQRVTAEMQDMKLHLETQQERNSQLEKKQRKFDHDVHIIQEETVREKAAKDRLQHEKDQMQTELMRLKNSLADREAEYDNLTIKAQRIEVELTEMSSAGSLDDKEVASLRHAKRDLEAKVKDQEEELDEQAGQIQMLEQAKLRLEMEMEKQKQKHNKELDSRDEEVEEIRTQSHRKMKQLEMQLEDERSEKSSLQGVKRELELKIREIDERAPKRDVEKELRLKKDLKRTRALLQDAQTMIEHLKMNAPSKQQLKQLKGQLEDSQFACAAAVKARKAIESELEDLQHQLDETSKSKNEVERKIGQLEREKTDLQSKLEEDGEEMAELLKKHKALVAQASLDKTQIAEDASHIAELNQQKENLESTVSELMDKLTIMEEGSTGVPHASLLRLESKIRDLESKLDLERTTKHRQEIQVGRLKENIQRLQEERDNLDAAKQRHQEITRRMERQLRDSREEFSDLQRKETEATQKKHDLEMEIAEMESKNEGLQADLKLAFRRIGELQAALEDDVSDSGDDDSRSESEISDDEELTELRKKFRARSRDWSDDSESEGEEPKRPSRKISSSPDATVPKENGDSSHRSSNRYNLDDDDSVFTKKSSWRDYINEDDNDVDLEYNRETRRAWRESSADADDEETVVKKRTNRSSFSCLNDMEEEEASDVKKTTTVIDSTTKTEKKVTSSTTKTETKVTEDGVEDDIEASIERDIAEMRKRHLLSKSYSEEQADSPPEDRKWKLSDGTDLDSLLKDSSSRHSRLTLTDDEKEEISTRQTRITDNVNDSRSSRVSAVNEENRIRKSRLLDDGPEDTVTRNRRLLDDEISSDVPKDGLGSGTRTLHIGGKTEPSDNSLDQVDAAVLQSPSSTLSKYRTRFQDPELALLLNDKDDDENDITSSLSKKSKKYSELEDKDFLPKSKTRLSSPLADDDDDDIMKYLSKRYKGRSELEDKDFMPKSKTRITSDFDEDFVPSMVIYGSKGRSELEDMDFLPKSKSKLSAKDGVEDDISSLLSKGKKTLSELEDKGILPVSKVQSPIEYEKLENGENDSVEKSGKSNKDSDIKTVEETEPTIDLLEAQKSSETKDLSVQPVADEVKVEASKDDDSKSLTPTKTKDLMDDDEVASLLAKRKKGQSEEQKKNVSPELSQAVTAADLMEPDDVASLLAKRRKGQSELENKGILPKTKSETSWLDKELPAIVKEKAGPDAPDKDEVKVKTESEKEKIVKAKGKTTEPASEEKQKVASDLSPTTQDEKLTSKAAALKLVSEEPKPVKLTKEVKKEETTDDKAVKRVSFLEKYTEIALAKDETLPSLLAEESKTVSNTSLETKTVSKTEKEVKIVSKADKETKNISKVALDTKDVSKSAEARKDVSVAGSKKTLVKKEDQEISSKTVSKAKEEIKTVSKTSQEVKTTKTVQDTKTAPKKFEEVKSVPNVHREPAPVSKAVKETKSSSQEVVEEKQPSLTEALRAANKQNNLELLKSKVEIKNELQKISLDVQELMSAAFQPRDSDTTDKKAGRVTTTLTKELQSPTKTEKKPVAADSGTSQPKKRVDFRSPTKAKSEFSFEPQAKTEGAVSSEQKVRKVSSLTTELRPTRQAAKESKPPDPKPPEPPSQQPHVPKFKKITPPGSLDGELSHSLFGLMNKPSKFKRGKVSAQFESQSPNVESAPKASKTFSSSKNTETAKKETTVPSDSKVIKADKDKITVQKPLKQTEAKAEVKKAVSDESRVKENRNVPDVKRGRSRDSPKSQERRTEAYKAATKINEPIKPNPIMIRQPSLPQDIEPPTEFPKELVKYGAGVKEETPKKASGPKKKPSAVLQAALFWESRVDVKRSGSPVPRPFSPEPQTNGKKASSGGVGKQGAAQSESQLFSKPTMIRKHRP
ncbi:unconventional myosin-XVIIIa-like isoform X5 [Branchiostoma floridae x Branchiostoma japonicum]